MRFITECELRQLYRKEPFTSYEVPKDVRLTPEAAQFLQDRRILIVKDSKEANRLNDKAAVNPSDVDLSSRSPMIEVEFDAIEAQLYLLQAKSASSGNSNLLDCLSQLRRVLDNIRAAMNSESAYEDEVETCDYATSKKSYSVYEYAITHIQAELIGHLSLLRVSIKRLQALLEEKKAFKHYDTYCAGISFSIQMIEGIIRHKVGGF